MGTTDNGYSAPPAEGIRDLVVDGAAFVPGVKDWYPVWAVLDHFWTQFDERVEWLRPGWCWGYAFRPNANDPNSLSRHSGAIATDGNAPLHPNGVPTRNTFTSAQIDEVHKILDEIVDDDGNRVLRWGGDYTGTPDAMHTEINAGTESVKQAARNIKETTVDQQDLEEIRKTVVAALNPVKEASIRQTQRIMTMLRDSAERDEAQAKMLRALVRDMKAENAAEVEAEADRLESKAKATIKELDAMERQPNHGEEA